MPFLPSASPTPAALPPPSFPTLYDFFAPGGMLSKSGIPYEFRKGQLEMAQAVEKALAENRHLMVEAGTGTGKTLAYLLPALRTGRRVIISTGTKNLQEQLFFKDIPFLESLLGPLRVTYMKGRGNYLCRHKLYALRAQPILNGLEEISQYHAIAEWEKATETGDRAEIDELPENSPLWAKLDARSEACLGQKCPDYERCFITEMRRKAAESDVIIVNHHLFFADLSIKQTARAAPDAGVLPEAAAVIFDEAHELEDVASSYFGITLSNVRFEELARDVELLLKSKQAGADVVITYGIGPELAQIANGMEKIGWKVPLLGSWTLSMGNFIDNAGKNGDGARMPQTFIQDGNTPKRKAFIDAYIKAYKPANDRISSPVSAAQGYDSVYILAAAITQAGSTDGPKVRAALENLNAKVDGVVTSYNKPFTHDDHEAIKAGMPVMGEVENGRVIPAK